MVDCWHPAWLTGDFVWLAIAPYPRRGPQPGKSAPGTRARTTRAWLRRNESLPAFLPSLARQRLVHAAGLARAPKQRTNHKNPACDGPCNSRSSLPITPTMYRTLVAVAPVMKHHRRVAWRQLPLPVSARRPQQLASCHGLVSGVGTYPRLI